MADLSRMTIEELRTTTAPGAQNELARRLVLSEAALARERERVAHWQVKWVQQAVHGALAESRAYRRSVLTGRCTP
jgi:hypothetical protein